MAPTVSKRLNSVYVWLMAILKRGHCHSHLYIFYDINNEQTRMTSAWQMSTHPARRTLICFCTTFLGGTGIPDIRNSWSILYETKILFWCWVYWVYVAVLVARCLLLRCHWFLLCFALWCFVYSMSVSVSFFCGVLYVIFSCACGVGCGTSRSVLAPFLHATSLFSDPSSYRTWSP